MGHGADTQRRFLVVEEDADHALGLMGAVTALGHAVFGPITSVEDAVRSAGGGWHGALIGHVGGRVRPMTDALRQHGVPFAVLRGEEDGPDGLPRCPDPRTLRGVVAALAQHAGPPPPRRRVSVTGRQPLIADVLALGLAKAAPDCAFEAAPDDAEATDADLLLVHLGAERLCGPWAAGLLERALADPPASGVAVLCDHADDADVARALSCGVRGYLPTSYALDVTASAVRLLLAGGVFVPAVAAAPTPPVAAPDELGPQLSQRQAQILELIAEGKPNKIIAYELSLKEATVKMHVRHLMRKLGVTNRTQAAFVRSQVAGTAQ